MTALALAAAAARPLPVERDILIVSGPAFDRARDPIFAAIEAVQALDAELTRACRLRDEDDPATCEFCDQVSDQTSEAMRVLTEIVPRTAAGLVALARHYAADAQANGDEVASYCVHHLALAIEAHVEAGYLLKSRDAPSRGAASDEPDPIIAAVDEVHSATRAFRAACKGDAGTAEDGRLEDEAGARIDRAMAALRRMTPTTTAGVVALAQFYLADAHSPGAETGHLEHLAEAFEAFAARAYLPSATTNAVSDFTGGADPIHAAIRRHRDGWQAFQDAPDVPKNATFGDPSYDVASAAEDAEFDAGQALLATTCASRQGVAALLVHLDWFIAEERDNLIRQDVFGQAFMAAHANLQLALGVRS